MQSVHYMRNNLKFWRVWGGILEGFGVSGVFFEGMDFSQPFSIRLRRYAGLLVWRYYIFFYTFSCEINNIILIHTFSCIHIFNGLSRFQGGGNDSPPRGFSIRILSRNCPNCDKQLISCPGTCLKK